MPEITNPQEPTQTETKTPEGDLLIEGGAPGGRGGSVVLQGGRGGAGGEPGKPGEPGEPGKIHFSDAPSFPDWDPKTRVPPRGGDVNLHVGEGHDGERDGVITLTARGGFLRRLWFLMIAPFTYLFVGRIRL